MGDNVAKKTVDAVNLNRALSLRVRGARWDEIAEACGYASPAAALKAVGTAMAAATQRAEESADQMRDTANLQLDALLREAWDMIGAQSVMDENGNVYDDRAVRLRAVDEARRLVADKAKLNGVASLKPAADDDHGIRIIGVSIEDAI